MTCNFLTIRIIYITLEKKIQILIFWMISRVKNRDKQICVQFFVDPITRTMAVKI